MGVWGGVDCGGVIGCAGYDVVHRSYNASALSFSESEVIGLVEFVFYDDLWYVPVQHGFEISLAEEVEIAVDAFCVFDSDDDR